MLLVALGYVIWAKQQRARQLASQVVRRHCKEQGLQLLDDTLVLDSLTFQRKHWGNWAVSRCYRFEFSSSGVERYAGRLRLSGYRVEQLELDAHRVP